MSYSLITLGELIKYLEKQDQSFIAPEGLSYPHSYRGYYECLAFEPKSDVKVADSLELARKCLGKTFHGYKGGQYLMNEYTDVYLARYGSTGSELSVPILEIMSGKEVSPSDFIKMMIGESFEAYE